MAGGPLFSITLKTVQSIIMWIISDRFLGIPIGSKNPAKPVKCRTVKNGSSLYLKSAPCKT